MFVGSHLTVDQTNRLLTLVLFCFINFAVLYLLCILYCSFCLSIFCLWSAAIQHCRWHYTNSCSNSNWYLALVHELTFVDVLLQCLCYRVSWCYKSMCRPVRISQ